MHVGISGLVGFQPWLLESHTQVAPDFAVYSVIFLHWLLKIPGQAPRMLALQLLLQGMVGQAL